MKFKYIGEDDCFCIELIAYNILPKDSHLKNGQIIDVPDDNKVVIDSLNVSGVFKKVVGSKKVNKKRK